MRLRRRAAADRTGKRLVWQASSLLLAYPDARQPDRLATIRQVLGFLPPEDADRLGVTLGYLQSTDPIEAATRYVDTFDMRRKTTLLLTYWTDGDTRNRGSAMLAFADAYRAAGARPPEGETPDHLAVVLEFAATVDAEAGERLLVAHRTAVDMLASALHESGSPYAAVLDAVSRTLPAATARDEQRARELAMAGPPAEAVGLQPFTLTVPPRRTDATRIPRREGTR
ncbi:nitrate reductase molybdenum cofactor assembly chaperone [Rhodococcus spelaei]|uniref:Nitrate reductase molybdenum cofactor assembly chaperone n=1 Tax=Rhodococcus spelaei TaxID=2546320 RepID=A0A541B3U0_9NOCA|nr:nitrate reductase molybdenum cofactor assembly chaperone [Rhodococcus spelaei]TQF66977.1 nitrate reductase molybdenum cofactor assembly chaperone [Rhodococcus spelaei]